MVSTFTPNLNLNLQGTGDNVNTWGQVLNNNVFSIVDAAMGNTLSLPLAAADVTLTTIQTQNNFIDLSGALLTNINIIFPQIGRTYFVRNRTTGNFTVTLKTSAVGGVTYVIPQGLSTMVVLNGTDVLALPPQTSLAPISPGFFYGLSISNNAVDPTNDIDIATGSAASDDATLTIMQLASILTKRIDANWSVGTNQGGLDTGSVGNGTYWVWLIKRSDTGVVDALFSTSATAPTMPLGYDRKRRIAPIVRASATILAFSYNAFSKFWEYSGSSTDTTTIATSPALRTVKVPVGVPVMARLGVAVANTSTGLMSIVNHWNPALGPTLPNTLSGAGHVFVNADVSQAMRFNFDAVTNSSAQVYNLATTTGGSTLTAYSLTTLGYFFAPGS
ncbi:hypothetical protein BMW22_15580 [Rhizobium leguminosarum]|uniref:Uncharacterized protein n=1 Tax=Rhizobium leguminosarum TaxID=384 RepID=A0A1L3ZB04_RHILE|nr:hypothetical protein [Rhizobium leguminosarum]API52845.1 hypothetical protein BMW22_15580 [Rhizobium leguminosarum]